MNATNQELLEKQLSHDKLSFFKKCRDKLQEITKDLDKQREKINSDDALLGDNTFFKFLNDLLAFKNNSKLNLMNELKENEKLSKEKFLTLLTNELEENQSLTKEQKEKLGKNLSNSYVQDLAFNLVNNKLSKQNGQEQESELKITTKDVVEVGIEIAKNPTPIGIAKAVGKKIIHKMMK